MGKVFDVIVIGAGIMGTSTALELAKKGMSVAVLEKDSLGMGPSSKSSAIIRQHYSNELTARMALFSLGVFQNFTELIGDSCGFTKTGFVVMVSAKDRAGLEANVALQQRIGIETEVLSPESLRDLLPNLTTSDFVTAAYEPASGYADPYLTVTAIARAARREGVEIFPETEVKDITFAGGKVTGVETTNGRFDAGYVVNCSGAWGAHVASLAGVQLPINPCRVQVAFFKRPSGHEAAHPVVGDFVNATYFRPETGSLTLVGLIDPAEADAVVNPDSFVEGVDDDFVLAAGDSLIRRYPAMENSLFAGGYASLYAITPDWHPIVDELPPQSGCFVCSGFSGHGFKLGPAVGRMMADLVTASGESPWDPHLFRFARFAEDDPVRGRYEYSIVG